MRLIDNLWFQVFLALAVISAAVMAYNQVGRSTYTAMKGASPVQGAPAPPVTSDAAAQKPPSPSSPTQGSALPPSPVAPPADTAHPGIQINSGSGQKASVSGAAPAGPRVSPQSTPATSDNQSTLFEQALQFDSEQNYKQAAQLYQKSCDADYSKACARLGALYEHGRGVERDMSRAAALYAKGCDKENAQVCTGLGYQYENGIGIGKDPAKAAVYYEKGCDGADGAACNNLGTLYERGLGVAADIKKAATYYEKGCLRDSAYGCNNLGLQYQKGTGVVERDLGRAAINFAKGCAGGIPQSCYNLGEAFWFGYGMKADPTKAKEMQQKVCKMGYNWGCDRLKALIGQN